MKTKLLILASVLSVSAWAQEAARSLGEQAMNPNMIRICTCLEQGKDANCQPLKAEESASGPRMPAATDHANR